MMNEWLFDFVFVTNAGMLIIVIGYTLVGAILAGIITHHIMSEREHATSTRSYEEGYRAAKGQFAPRAPRPRP